MCIYGHLYLFTQEINMNYWIRVNIYSLHAKRTLRADESWQREPKTPPPHQCATGGFPRPPRFRDEGDEQLSTRHKKELNGQGENAFLLHAWGSMSTYCCLWSSILWYLSMERQALQCIYVHVFYTISSGCIIFLCTVCDLKSNAVFAIQSAICYH